LLVPPFFLHRYANGVEVYGEWITLSAAIAYLNTLNYGIQNYSCNQVTILYNRGEVEEAKAVQASAFRLILMAVLVPAITGASVLLMPLSRWLGLKHIDSRAASITVFLLILQLVINWCFSFIASSYMAVGEAHRGTNWVNAQRLAAALAMAALLWNRSSFPVLALTQVASIVLFVILLVIDMRIRAPLLLPEWRLGSWNRARAMAKPTGWFALLAVSGFLQWQGPVLVIQMILGPASVAVFALTRMVFNMSRQIMVVITVSISQEITHLVGQRDWAQLRRLYEVSEKVVLLLVPPMTMGTLLAMPFLFSIWLHKRSLYEPAICLTMAAISAVMGIKEHKYQFQWSSNEHSGLSRFMLIAYTAMLGLSVPMLKAYGIEGFLAVWMITEIAQVVYILHLNKRLFPGETSISTAPVIRLGVVLAVCFTLVAWPCWHNADWPLSAVIGVAVTAAAGLALASYFLFDLREVVGVLQSRLKRQAAVAE
jgi:O-antigen/teichoic acid export membrane protein